MAKRYGLAGAPKIPSFFKEWRDSREWTQDELAAQMDTTVAMVSRIETGERDWGRNYLEAFGHVVGCHPLAPIISPPRTDVDVSAVLRALAATASASAQQIDDATSVLRSLSRADGLPPNHAAKVLRLDTRKENS